MKVLTPKDLKDRKIQANLSLISPWHEKKGKDLSLIYKQKKYSSKQFLEVLHNLSSYHDDSFSLEMNEEELPYLFTFIHWANQPYKMTAIRLGILSFIYLFLLLIFWGLWALKLQHRVIRRYDRYDVPSFPKNAPENLTKASNDP